MSAENTTSVSRIISASPQAVYQAFLNPNSVASWLPPDTMTATVHNFDAREGGAIHMSLHYPDSDTTSQGKSSEHTDTFKGLFSELIPNEKIVWAVQFESDDASFSGKMTVSWILAPSGNGTQVTALCENIPSGIRPEDNEEGSRSTLEKLAAFVEK